MARPKKEPSAEWLSVREAAALYGVSQDTIRRGIARGEIEAVRFGPKVIRIRVEQLAPYGRPLTAGSVTP